MIPTKITIPTGAYDIKVEIGRNSLSKVFPTQICEFCIEFKYAQKYILGLKNGKNNVISRQVLGTHEVVHGGVNWKLTNRYQTLSAKGPTTSDYHIMLFVRDAHQNININVDYYTRKPNKYISRGAHWGSTGWKCNAGFGSARGTCVKTRKAKCIDRSRRVSDQYCDFNQKPPTMETFQCTNGCPPRNML